MKRLCYLVLWFLTGFSIATNQTGNRPTHLLLGYTEICAPQASPVVEPDSARFLLTHEPESAPKPKSRLMPVTSLICSAER
jgi:hypothetical protein